MKPAEPKSYMDVVLKIHVSRDDVSTLCGLPVDQMTTKIDNGPEHRCCLECLRIEENRIKTLHYTIREWVLELIEDATIMPECWSNRFQCTNREAQLVFDMLVDEGILKVNTTYTRTSAKQPGPGFGGLITVSD